MLGAVVPERTDEYSSSTSAPLAALVQSNTDIQCPYRIPVSDETHESMCEDGACHNMYSGDMNVRHVHHLMRQVQRSQQNIT
eukprot:7998745-Karenia_brevis.AAC.1